MKSIRTTLLAWLTLGVALGIGATAWLTYLQARDEANELFDYQMKQLVASLPHQTFPRIDAPGGPTIDVAEDVVIQIWDRTGLRVFASHLHPGLPQHALLGFANISTSEGTWRTFGAQLGDAVIQVAQPMSARNRLATATALRTIAPLLLLLPILGVLVWVAVDHGLRPIRRLASELGGRDSRTLAPLSGEGLAEEIAPLQQALNDLFARLERALNLQRAFVADAAHELRTPLTALRLQLQLVERAGDAESRRVAIDDLKRGLDRAAHLVQQLLTLSRQEPGVTDRPFSAIDLPDLCRLVVGEHAAMAAARHIDLGMGEAAPASIDGDSEGLRILLGNLVDNALRYTPPGGHVDVATGTDETGHPWLSVSDDGPGIPPAERQQVFNRFYRREGQEQAGSGLGLAIVQNIAGRHGASLRLGDGPGGHGLVVQVTFRRPEHPAGSADSQRSI